MRDDTLWRRNHDRCYVHVDDCKIHCFTRKTLNCKRAERNISHVAKYFNKRSTELLNRSRYDLWPSFHSTNIKNIRFETLVLKTFAHKITVNGGEDPGKLLVTMSLRSWRLATNASLACMASLRGSTLPRRNFAVAPKCPHNRCETPLPWIGLDLSANRCCSYTPLSSSIPPSTGPYRRDGKHFEPARNSWYVRDPHEIWSTIGARQTFPSCDSNGTRTICPRITDTSVYATDPIHYLRNTSLWNFHILFNTGKLKLLIELANSGFICSW